MLKKTMIMMLVLAGIFTGCNDSSSGGGGVATVTLDPHLDDGPYTISGSVQLPDGASAGKYVKIQVNKAMAYSEADTTQKSGKGNLLFFRIVGVTDGDYEILIETDQTGNLVFGDSGDFKGYYDGTVDVPVQDSVSAVEVTVSGASVENVDFGIGVIP